MKAHYRYADGFVGFLTCIFEIYERKTEPLSISSDNELSNDLFSQTIEVYPDFEKARRVKKGLLKYLNQSRMHAIYKVFLSEVDDVELLLYKCIRMTLLYKQDVFDRYTEEVVLSFQKILKSVNREEHRMHAFVRFQRTDDDLYFATISPDFNVMPLLPSFFQNRFADQRWLIYDVKRKYGIYYDLNKVMPIETDAFLTDNYLKVLHDDEKAFQHLWKDYFDAVNIKERKNDKLHIQHVPKRYWKYLPEKFLNVG